MAQEPGGDGRVEYRTAGGDTPERPRELLQIADGVLEQVADAGGVGGEDSVGAVNGGVVGEHEERGVREAFTELGGRHDVGLGEHEIRSVGGGPTNEVVGVRGDGEDGETVLGEDAAQAFSEQALWVAHHDRGIRVRE